MNEAAWELICKEEGNHFHEDQTERLQIPGGWLYRTKLLAYDENSEVIANAVAMTFVPAP